MVSSTTCTAQYNIIGFKESRSIFNSPVPYFYKRKKNLQKKMSFFPLENWNVPIFSGFETQKSGQLAGM